MKNLCLCMLMLLCLVNASAQTTTPAAKPGFKLFFEKAYLHTNRDIYAPGDTLWFKAYLVSAQDNTPANSSGNLHVELVSPDNKILSSELIRLENGLGNGDFDLSDTLAGGTYRLRAYTSWMRNFGDNFIFEKEISIPGDKVAGAVAVAGKTKLNKDKVTTSLNTASATATDTNLIANVNFYPEGGSLIEDINSLVAVKAEDGFGKGMPALGAVVTASGDTVAHFSCDSLGMGLFALLPLKGQSYHAVVKNKNYKLPAALSKGLALQVRQTDSLIRVVVSSSADLAAMTIKPNCNLVVKHGGVALLSQPLQLSAQQTAIRIPTGGLPQGIAAITLYDESGKPACERLVYIHQPKAESMTIGTDKKIYQPKEKVSVQINAGAAANLSLAVVDASVIPEQADDIASYLMLESEVKGNIEHAHRYFDTTNVNRFKQLDLLLMTQGWREFIWRRLEKTAIRITYAAENGIIVSGRVEDEINHKLLPGVNVTLRADASKGIKMFSDETDAAGHFNITKLMFNGNQHIKLAAVNNKGERKGSFIIDTLTTAPIKIATITGVVRLSKDSATIQSFVTKSNSSNTAARITRLREVKVTAKKDVIKMDNGRVIMTFGLQQVFNIALKDYKYDNLTYFLLQNDKRAVSSNGSRPGVAYMVHGHRFYPELIVNGSSFHIDKNLYWNMPMNKYKKVEVHEVMAGYIIELITKDNALVDNPGTLSVDIPGYYQARTFYQPPPNLKTSAADYRTTIYWQPNLKTDATGKATVSFFNNSCTQGRVIIQGLTNAGNPVAATVVYATK